jgi:hypothetical protein
MRFMIMGKTTPEPEAGVMPSDEQVSKVIAYHEELADAGVLPDGSGLQRSSKGWRLRYSGDQRTVVDGPFTKSKELIAGYELIQVKSQEEAMEWVHRFSNPGVRGGEAVEAVWRIQAPRLIGALTRLTGDLDVAEDLALDALRVTEIGP